MLECNNCKLKYYKLCGKICDFCDIVTNLKKKDVYKYVICYSKLDQKDIIIKTYEYFMKNDKIPIPNEIDINAKIISINPFMFNKYIKISNYKIFFTNTIDRNNIKVKRLCKTYPIEKLNINNYSGIELKKIDENTYNEYITILNI
jgi:hypothetical protein